MRAVVLQATGGPEMLVPAEVPVPKAGPGQVLVRTEVIAVSRGETMMRSGAIPLPFALPAVIGAEAAGIVEDVGEGADPGLAGARVTMVTGAATQRNPFPSYTQMRRRAQGSALDAGALMDDATDQEEEEELKGF